MNLLKKSGIVIALLSVLCFAGAVARADEWMFKDEYLEVEALFVETGTWTNHTSYAPYDLSLDAFEALGWNSTAYELYFYANVTTGTNVSFYILDEPNHTNLTLGFEPTAKLMEYTNFTIILENFTIPATPTNMTYFFVFDNRASALNATIDFSVDIWEWVITEEPPIPFIELPAALAIAVIVMLGAGYARRRRKQEGA